jgi:hypothetical protein
MTLTDFQRKQAKISFAIFGVTPVDKAALRAFFDKLCICFVLRI